MNLKWYYKLLIFIVVVCILTGFAIIYFQDNNLQILSIFSSITTIIIGFLYFKKDKDNEEDKVSKLLEMIDKEKKEHETSDKVKDGQIEEMQKHLDAEQYRNIQLSNIVDNIGITLNKEDIKTDDLIKNLKTPLRAIFFMKNSEKKEKYFVDNVYPYIHAHGIRKGVNIIPPRYINQDKTDKEILEWFFKEVDRYVPKNYEYNIPFALVVDISSIGSHDSIVYEHSRSHFNWSTKVPPQDIAPHNTILKYLEGKKNISLRDIMEIPNIMFLVDDLKISPTDRAMLKKNSKKIINKIIKQIGSDTLRTTDLATFDEMELTFILRDLGIKEPFKASKMLIGNAQILKIILDRRFSFN